MAKVFEIREYILSKYGITQTELLDIVRLVRWESRADYENHVEGELVNRPILTLPQSINEIDQVRTETDWQSLGQATGNVIAGITITEPDNIKEIE